MTDKARAAANTMDILRSEMRRQDIKAFWIPHGDCHQNEFCPPCYRRLTWATGFTGSAGMALVTGEKAALFVDGRYTLQAPKQVDTEIFDILDFRQEVIQDWIKENIAPLGSLSYDPWLMSCAQVTLWTKWCQSHGITFKAIEASHGNPIDVAWVDRPAHPKENIWVYPHEYAGQSHESKKETLVQDLKALGIDWFMTTQLDAISWLLNLRGKDVSMTPVFLAFAAMNQKGDVHVWTHGEKVTPAIQQARPGITWHPYEMEKTTAPFFKECKVGIDDKKTPAFIASFIQANGGSVSPVEDPIQLQKAIKNPTEQEKAREAHGWDALALTRLMAWLEETWPKTPLTEMDVSDHLLALRQKCPLFLEPSFDTIAATGPNGAIVHYKPTPQTNRTLKKGDIFLMDSGGQYMGGTTDITRAFCLGTPTDHQRHMYTLVLKGHIRLALACFPNGTTGGQLDALARYDLWQHGLTYAHGTGHGVGSCLCVHEGPQNISPAFSSVPLKPGMILSNEPGYYETDAFGIRIENLVLVVPAKERGFLRFETLTLAPIHRTMVCENILTDQEREWLYAYHQRVCHAVLPRDDTLKGYLHDQERFFI